MHKFLLPLLAAFLSACSSAPEHSTHVRHTPPVASHTPGGSTAVAADSTVAPAADMNDVAMYALSLSDTPYRYGGNTPETGFDCSGFVRHVFKHTLGMELPRTSHEMSRLGRPEAVAHLQPGDLVFYNTQHKPYSHVGIYLGDGQFVHSPRTGSSVRVENMNEGYWLAHYNGARRISP